MIVFGALLIGVGALWVFADWGRLSKRMPSQVVPRRYASVPLAAGAVLLFAGLVVAFGNRL